MPQYPPHINPAKKPPNTYYDDRGRGHWYYRKSNGRGDRGKKTLLGDSTMTNADLVRAVQELVANTTATNTLTQLSLSFQATQDWAALAPSTQADYLKCHKSICERVTKQAVVFGDLAPNDITTVLLRKYRDARKLESPSRAKKELAYLKRLFAWAVEYGKVDSNPARDVTTKRLSQPREHYVTDEDYFLALCLAPTQIALLMHICLLTGRRRLDVLDLTLSDMDDEGIYFHEGKTGKPSIVLWSDELQQLVCTIGFANERLFSLSVAALDTAWQRLMGKVTLAGGTRFQLKDLRAKHASDMESVGGDATANLLHSSRSLTRRHYLRKPTRVVPLR
jgi:integrase